MAQFINSAEFVSFTGNRETEHNKNMIVAVNHADLQDAKSAYKGYFHTDKFLRDYHVLLLYCSVKSFA